MTREDAPGVRIEPLTAERWDDLVTLFGARGAYGGCWCMWFRKPNAAWSSAGGDRNRRDLRDLAQAGRVPGLLAYAGDRPVGWVSVAPRTEFTRISGVPALGSDEVPPDDVWSVVCFYIDRSHRRRGIGRMLLAEAVAHAQRGGARVVEAYPVPPKDGAKADENVYTGVLSMYRDAGFREVGRFARWRAVPQVTDPDNAATSPAKGRPIVGWSLRSQRRHAGTER